MSKYSITDITKDKEVIHNWEPIFSSIGCKSDTEKEYWEYLFSQYKNGEGVFASNIREKLLVRNMLEFDPICVNSAWYKYEAYIGSDTKQQLFLVRKFIKLDCDATRLSAVLSNFAEMIAELHSKRIYLAPCPGKDMNYIPKVYVQLANILATTDDEMMQTLIRNALIYIGKCR